MTLSPIGGFSAEVDFLGCLIFNAALADADLRSAERLLGRFASITVA